MELQKITRLSLFLSLSVVLNIIEGYFPFFNGTIPGLKLGLANSIILFVLYQYSFRDAFTLSLLRVFLVGLLRTGLFSISFFLSLGGAILSIVGMFLAKKTKLSILGVSVIGSICHSFGQVFMVLLLLKNEAMIYYAPWVLLFSIPSGIVIGILSKGLVNYFQEELNC